MVRNAFRAHTRARFHLFVLPLFFVPNVQNRCNEKIAKSQGNESYKVHGLDCEALFGCREFALHYPPNSSVPNGLAQLRTSKRALTPSRRSVESCKIDFSQHGGYSSVAERQTVALDVVGSTPTTHPNFLFLNQRVSENRTVQYRPIAKKLRQYRPLSVKPFARLCCWLHAWGPAIHC